MNQKVSQPHLIRLRGPWEYCVLAAEPPPSVGAECTMPSFPLAGKVTMPADWGATLGADFRGKVAYTRRFNCPTGLVDGTRVELVVERVDARGTVRLNGEILGQLLFTDPPLRIEVAKKLTSRNELTVEVELNSEMASIASTIRPGRELLPGGLIGEVRLEIFAVI